MRYTIETIGRVHSPYTQKFGIARQPGLVPSAEIVIELKPEFTADSIRGLEGFGYIWLHFIFHGVLGEGWSPMVRRRVWAENGKWACLPPAARIVPTISAYRC